MGYSTRNRVQGFTLIELLIAMALALVIIASLSSTFIIQQKTYRTQEQIAEMTQNARAAIDIMTREIRMTGYGIINSNYSNLPTWINWISGITFGAQPALIQTGTGALGTDIIHVAACFDGPKGWLNTATIKGATSLPLKSGDGSEFNLTTKRLINIGDLENAVITNRTGDTLTIDTNPNTTGNQGLKYNHQADESVSIVKVISYSIVQDDDGSYILKRNENLGAGRQPLAENIVNLQVNTVTDSSGKLRALEIDPLTAQTDKPDPNYSQNNGYRTFDQRAYITPPNLLIK